MKVKRSSVLAILLVIWPVVSGAANVIKPIAPTSERACTARGGDWTTLELSYPGKQKICDLKAADAGSSCSASTECQGLCLAPEAAKFGSIVTGTCSPYVANFGNLIVVEHGRAVQLNVE